MRRVTLKITGLVQGVFFRAYLCEHAADLGVTGWTANESDGSVGVVAEGSENAMDDFIQCCSSGPSTARVDKVEVAEEPYSGEFSDFEIRY